MVGLGGISIVHRKGWKTASDAQLVAVCDIVPEKAQTAALETGAKMYTDFEQMLANEEFSILDICTPTYCHVEQAVKAMKAGKHVLVEKPVSLNIGEVALLYQTARENHVLFMVAHVIRFWDEYVYLKAAIENNLFGKVLSGDFYRMSEVPRWSYQDWMRNESLSGLVPFDLHIHDLDFIVWTFGNPEDVKYYRGRDGYHDHVEGLYQYNGFYIRGEAAWFDCAYPFRSGYTIQFEQGILELRDGVLTMYHKDGAVTPIDMHPKPEGDSGINIPVNDAYSTEIHYFIDCVKNGRAPLVKQEELEAVLKLVHQF